MVTSDSKSVMSRRPLGSNSAATNSFHVVIVPVGFCCHIGHPCFLERRQEGFSQAVILAVITLAVADMSSLWRRVLVLPETTMRSALVNLRSLVIEWQRGLFCPIFPENLVIRFPRSGEELGNRESRILNSLVTIGKVSLT